MTKPEGTVISISGSYAVVSVEQMPPCPRCAEGRGCGAGLFGAGAGPRVVTARLPDGTGVRIGDTVRVVVAPRELLGASLLAYGGPLVGLLLGTLVAAAWPESLPEGAAIALAAAGLGAGLTLGRLRLRKADCARRFQPLVEPPA